MFVKKIELVGFKSFAEKTEVELSGGVTAVVGPNGCGKSNIADALQWVLGESNVRNIRGQKAVDVIFNGTEKRKSQGLAEVSLTIDNSDNTLPINYNEVTVTRRMYRSGEAEFFINKTRCRLKDIYELFLDTGVGREAYSFITQGQIDAILSAKPEDRRDLLEEAAGIKKYRYRREEAVRKLDKTEANLTRVRDIMSEIDGQLEPLAEQAEQAKRFNEYTSRLREIEIGLLIRDMRRLSESLEETRLSKTGSGDQVENLDKRLSDLEWEKEKQASRLQQMEEEVDNARRVQQTISANVQRLESKSALLEEKLRSAKSSSERTAEEIAQLEQKLVETRERIARLELEESACTENEQEERVSVDECARVLADLDTRYQAATRAVDEQKATYLELAKQLATRRNALQNSRDRVLQLEALVKKHKDESDALTTQKIDADKRREEVTNEIAASESKISELAVEIGKLQEERSKAEQEASIISKRQAEAARDIAARSSRLSTLREMAEAHEGFFDGVRNTMAAKKAGRLRGDFAVVADVISVPDGYETAIETALGASLQDIITDSVEDAKEAIAFLKENQAGRATFLPLDNLRSSRDRVQGKLDPRSGAVGIAADLIGYDAHYDPAIRLLLGRTIVADNIHNAVYLSKHVKDWNKIVTLDGELIVPTGAMTGGLAKKRGPGLLLRKQEIDALTRELADLDRASAGLDKQAQGIKGRLGDINSRVQSAEESLSESRIGLAEQRRRLDFTLKEVERLAKQLDIVGLEKDESEILLKDENNNIVRLETELAAAGEENTDLDRRVAVSEHDIEDLAKRRAEAREELMRLNVSLASAGERLTSLRAALRESRETETEINNSLRSRGEQVGNLSDDLNALSDEKESVDREVVTQRDLLTAADKSLNDLLEKRAAEMEKAGALDADMRATSSERNLMAQEIHDAEVREARMEVQIQQCADRLMEEYEITVAQAMDWPEDIEVERGTATEVARLRREIKDMGQVNTGAIAEYDRIKERWDFLTEQRSDLESARDQILTAIDELDTNTHGLFMETFNVVAGHFENIFTRLFGGGQAKLTLTDPNNLLETGIDVTVQPPGKKLQDMALLSGGERALTATALVFSLLMARPSPIVLMDEVDAPLDESNVERFADVLKDFAINTQFIVVTHNRATMEAADNLYGVTMEEAGVSKIISVKLAGSESEEEKKAFAELVGAK